MQLFQQHFKLAQQTWQRAASDLREQPNRTNMSADFSQPAEKIRGAISQYCLNGNK